MGCKETPVLDQKTENTSPIKETLLFYNLHVDELERFYSDLFSYFFNENKTPTYESASKPLHEKLIENEKSKLKATVKKISEKLPVVEEYYKRGNLRTGLENAIYEWRANGNFAEKIARDTWNLSYVLRKGQIDVGDAESIPYYSVLKKAKNLEKRCEYSGVKIRKALIDEILNSSSLNEECEIVKDVALKLAATLGYEEYVDKTFAPAGVYDHKNDIIVVERPERGQDVIHECAHGILREILRTNTIPYEIDEAFACALEGVLGTDSPYNSIKIEMWRDAYGKFDKREFEYYFEKFYKCLKEELKVSGKLDKNSIKKVIFDVLGDSMEYIKWVELDAT